MTETPSQHPALFIMAHAVVDTCYHFNLSPCALLEQIVQEIVEKELEKRAYLQEMTPARKRELYGTKYT